MRISARLVPLPVLFTLDEYRQLLEDDKPMMGSHDHNSTTTGGDHKRGADTHGFCSRPRLSPGSRQGTRGLESAIREHCYGGRDATSRRESDGTSQSHSRATWDRDGGKSAAVPQVEVWVLVRERLDEVPLLGQVETIRQVPNAEYRTIVMSLSNLAYQPTRCSLRSPKHCCWRPSQRFRSCRTWSSFPRCRSHSLKFVRWL
uniref:Uncharacterized protein n=1 Tax=Noctiluca scintillans TaxID=2966 RepID=A0A7S1F496_NOCSC|mmetsp:Transcript_30987/g.82340  ORF Transcript_30987/g.82340 Transcript_30987/m.82340 type:complete len:202 (+) Transcript_30987:84-689(+)